VDSRDVVTVEPGSGPVLKNVTLNDRQASSQAEPRETAAVWDAASRPIAPLERLR
jgi:hypothetical protein